VVKGQFESGIQGMDQAAMLDMLAQLRMSLGEAEEAARLLSETKEVVDKLGSDSAQPLLDSVLEHMGSMYTSLGKPEEALPYYQRSLKIQEELHGQDSPLIVKVLLGLATTYSDMNDSSHAIEVYNRVLSIIEKTRGSNDEALVMPLSRLGHSLLEEGRIDEAELSLVRALRLAEQLFGEYDGRVGVATCALARVKAAQGDVDESVSLYRKGLQIMEGCSKFADMEPTMEAVRSDLAELLNLLERSEEAQELWEENLRVKERIVGSDDPQLVVHLQNLATSYAASGKHDKCEPLLQHSLKLVTSSFGPNSPQLSIPLECLATTLHLLDRDDEAEPLARQALKLRECSFGSNSATVGKIFLSCLTLVGVHISGSKC
jgi:tetratricopeptide (TPR) repeat protein